MEFADEIVPSPHLTNTSWRGDRISPACDRSLVNHPENDQVYRDAYHGNAWSRTPALGAAVYGKTQSFPPSPIENLGSGKYLRVPYRRIPIIDVHSVEELANFAQSVVNTESIRGVWRGQVRQYQLPRSHDDRLRLYGDATVEEPSLLPSASRDNIYFPDFFEAWAGLLDLFMEQHVQYLSKTYPSRREELLRATENFRCSYGYRLWGLATAQHYGLPSVGLDVTHDINVALFFALHRFTTDASTGAMSMTRAVASDDPVIYGLGGLERHDLLDDAELAPSWLQCARPKAQGASFFTTGWGEAGNKAADRIYVAFRLVNHTEWQSPLNLRQVFPCTQDDVLLDFLLTARDRYTDPEIQKLLKRIYFVP